MWGESSTAGGGGIMRCIKREYLQLSQLDWKREHVMLRDRIRVQVATLIKGEPLRRELQAFIDRTRQKATKEETRDGQNLMPEGFDSLPGRLENECYPHGAIDKFLFKHILSYLPCPLPITASELLDGINPLLWELKDDKLPSLQSLSDEISGQIDWHAEAEFDFCRAESEFIGFKQNGFVHELVMRETDAEWAELGAKQTTIWSNALCSIHVASCRKQTVQERGEPQEITRVMAKASILGTPSASSRTAKSLSRLLPSLAKVLFSPGSRNAVPDLSPSAFVEHQPILMAALDAYFEKPERKDTYRNRVRAAIDLLTESDRQENDAIAAALCFAAVDALIGLNLSGEIGTHIITCCSRLLEPDLAYRMNAEQKIRGIYEMRNRVFHRGDLDYIDTDRIEARFLASSVLAALLSHFGLQRRLGEKESAMDDFTRMLKDGKYSDQPISGVIETAATKLWRSA